MLNQIIKFNASSYRHCKTFFGQEARLKLLEGIKDVNKATQTTLGPKGRNVVLEYEVGVPRVTKDGVTVARSIQFKDNFKDVGASLIRQAAGNTNMFAGDGTTTSTLLTSTLIEKGLKYLSYGVNPIEMKRGIDKGRNEVISFLEEMKQEVNMKSKDDLINLSSVSTNYDPFLSQLISDALFEVGVDGMIEIEPGNQLQTELFFTNGVGLTRPYASIEFIKDKSSNIVELNYPLVVCANQQINKIKQIVPVLEIAKKLKKQLLIIAEDITSEVMSNLVFNQRNGHIEMSAITVPGMGDYSRIVIEDLALITGATLADPEEHIYLEDFTLENLGKIHKVISTSQDTHIYGGQGNKDTLEKRMEELRKEISVTTKEFKKKILRDRLGRLSGKTAIMMLGGTNEYEMMETRDKIMDALNTVKLAMKHGFLPGGGTSLLRASTILDFVEYENFDQKCGIDLLREVLKEPIKQLHRNHGENGEIVIDNLLNKYNQDLNIGYNLNTDKYVNMIEEGIVDSFPIVKSALLDGISVGSLVLTTEAALIKEKKYQPPKVNTYRKDIF